MTTTVATELEVGLWYCLDCFRSGALLIRDANVYDVIEGLEKAHAAESVPRSCNAKAGRIRLIRPNGWFGEATGNVYATRIPAHRGTLGPDAVGG